MQCYEDLFCFIFMPWLLSIFYFKPFLLFWCPGCWLLSTLKCAGFQLQALDTFNTAVVSPIYYAMFTSLTILASVIMFKVILQLTLRYFFPLSSCYLICISWQVMPISDTWSHSTLAWSIFYFRLFFWNSKKLGSAESRASSETSDENMWLSIIFHSIRNRKSLHLQLQYVQNLLITQNERHHPFFSIYDCLLLQGYSQLPWFIFILASCRDLTTVY